MVTPAHSAPARGSIQHRIAVWISATLLALSFYMASCPLAFDWSQRSGFGRFLVPATRVIYAPLFLWVQRPQWPGSAAYMEYVRWVLYHLQEPKIGNAQSNAWLGVTMSFDFSGTSLRDAVQYMSEVNSYPIELDPDVNGDTEVTLQSTGPLRDMLTELLEPLDLQAWPADGRIVIGSPAAIQRIRASDRANHPLPTMGWLLLALFCISAVSLLILLRRRRGANQVSTEPTG